MCMHYILQQITLAKQLRVGSIRSSLRCQTGPDLKVSYKSGLGIEYEHNYAQMYRYWPHIDNFTITVYNVSDDVWNPSSIDRYVTCYVCLVKNISYPLKNPIVINKAVVFGPFGPNKKSITMNIGTLHLNSVYGTNGEQIPNGLYHLALLIVPSFQLYTGYELHNPRHSVCFSPLIDIRDKYWDRIG